MRFVAEASRRCSAVSRGCADVMRSSGKPDKRSRDADRLPKTMVAYAPLAQSTLDNRERAVAAEACRLPPSARLSLPARLGRNYVRYACYLVCIGEKYIYILLPTFRLILEFKVFVWGEFKLRLKFNQLTLAGPDIKRIMYSGQ